MKVSEAVASRASIRAFSSNPVKNKLIEEILKKSSRSPSGGNLQPWKIFVVNNSAMSKFLEFQKTWTEAEIPAYDIYPPKLKEPYRTSRFQLGEQMYELLGIGRDDKDARNDWVLRGFRQFDAPVAVIVTFDSSLKDDDISKFDCGAVVNGLVNAGWSRGLGAVINSQGIMQSPVVRKYANIPDDETIMICVAMGYPDFSFPANKVVSKRRPVSEVVNFKGF